MTEGTRIQQVQVDTGSPATKAGGFRVSRLRMLITVLFIIIVLLTLFLLIRGEGLKTNNGNSSITGIVQTVDGQGVEAEVFIIGGNHSTYSSSDGSFQLDGISAGEHTLIAGYQGMGVEIPVNIQAHSVMDIGIIQVEATVMP